MPKKKESKQQKTKDFGERTRKVQNTLAQYTIAFSQCVPTNCEPYGSIRPINEIQLAKFVEDIQGNGWSDQSVITVVERLPSDPEALAKYPTPIGNTCEMYKTPMYNTLRLLIVPLGLILHKFIIHA